MSIRRLFVLAAAAIALQRPGGLEAQQRETGTISGRVTDQATQQPLAGAQVLLTGTTRGTITNDRGEYRLADVPAGSVQIRVLRIGYAGATRTVAVTAGETATADVALTATAIQLDLVVVTASGEQERKRETGNAVATIRTDSVQKAAITNFSDLVSSRAPNVTVTTPSGTTGGGSRIRIRGSNSISLSNEPLIIIDGIRATNDNASISGPTSISVGGQNPTLLDNLEPEDIQDVTILKGPAAAAQYGTAAANGVLIVTTKHGTAGRTRWTAYGEGGGVHNITTFPANYGRLGTLAGGAGVTSSCSLLRESIGDCTVIPNTAGGDSIRFFNPLEQAGVFRGGWREHFGGNVSGGGDVTSYFVSGNYSREQGVYANNEVRRLNGRANLHSQLRDNLGVTVNAAYLRDRIRLPQNDNDTYGPIGSGLLGSSIDDPVRRGFLGNTPAVFTDVDTRQDVDRFLGAVSGTWAPIGWLSIIGTTGVDFASRYDQQLIPPGVIAAPDPNSTGLRQSNPYHLWTYTANLGGTASYQLRPGLSAKSGLGIQYNDELLQGTLAAGQGLASGTGSLAGATTGLFNTEQNSEIVTIGVYGQQQLAWKDRVFLSAALRGDDNSAFGSSFNLALYPSASLSWVIGEEPFFPKSDVLSSLRLRAAYGESGQRPGFRSNVTYYVATAVKLQGQELGGAQLTGVGNQDLKPERSREVEVGFDAGLWRDRLSLEATFYHKRTSDALVARQLPASTGANTQFINVGEMTNKGVELALGGNVLRTPAVEWDLNLSGSVNNNKLVRLGPGIDTIRIGLSSNAGDFIQRFAPGSPAGGFWQPTYTYDDADGNGIIAPNEVTVSDQVSYLGAPFPKTEVSIGTTVTLFKRVRIAGLLDHRGGNKIYNGTAAFRCVIIQRCADAYLASTPLAAQARIVASALGTDAGFIEDASFWKLRELSVTFMATDAMARRLGVEGLSLTLAGRNLKTWTDYTGFDPELNFNGTSNYDATDFLTQPPVRYWTARVTVNW
ncbi:MAG: SusC/RagA family TonB-linked outer membrane protein [Gemmatimonadaceae bacterium]|nr:SusC/RagA family TonB-linked outer membrane protein [Gemmatimonadaceae bacterium]